MYVLCGFRYGICTVCIMLRQIWYMYYICSPTHVCTKSVYFLYCIYVIILFNGDITVLRLLSDFDNISIELVYIQSVTDIIRYLHIFLLLRTPSARHSFLRDHVQTLQGERRRQPLDSVPENRRGELAGVSAGGGTGHKVRRLCIGRELAGGLGLGIAGRKHRRTAGTLLDVQRRSADANLR